MAGTPVCRCAYLLILGLAFAAVIPPAMPSNSSQAQEASNPIHVSDLNDRPVIGRLGHPLGTIVQVGGVIADGSHTRMKADEGEILLRIQSVNGGAVEREIVMHLHSFPASRSGEPPPAAGCKFAYIGYETGGFIGVPDDAFKYVPQVATQSHHFSTWFVALKAWDEAR